MRLSRNSNDAETFYFQPKKCVIEIGRKKTRKPALDEK